jgi:hypothetical protein
MGRARARPAGEAAQLPLHPPKTAAVAGGRRRARPHLALLRRHLGQQLRPGCCRGLRLDLRRSGRARPAGAQGAPRLDWQAAAGRGTRQRRRQGAAVG